MKETPLTSTLRSAAKMADLRFTIYQLGRVLMQTSGGAGTRGGV